MSTVLHQCTCPHCSILLEFDEAYFSQVIGCLSCSGSLTLPDKPFAPPPKDVFGKLFGKFKTSLEKSKDKRELRQMLLDAVSDGFLSSDELESVQAFMRDNGLHPVEMQEWSREIFKKAVDSLSAANVSTDRIRSIEEIKVKLAISEHDIASELDRFYRLRFIVEIRGGKLPAVNAPNVILRSTEKALWVQPGQLWENRVVTRRYEGGSAGISFRIAKGITLRSGGTRGRLVSDNADVPVSTGNFIVTNRRFIFEGDQKSFETEFEKILSIDSHLDGIRFSESNRQKPRQISYAEPNGDIIVEILSQTFSGTVGI